MPSKSDKIPINNPKLDRRVKLTQEQREEIHNNKQGHSQRELARMYNVSRRLITFILNPEKQKENYQRRVENGGTKQYYDKEKNTTAMREHRQYKKELLKQGKIK